MDSNTVHLLLGALLAVVGGMLGELWREGRTNRAETRALRGEVEGLLAICDQMIQAPQDLSLIHWLPQLTSFARDGLASSRSWLPSISDRADRAQILEVFARASAVVGVVDQFVAIEQAAIADPDPTKYGTLIRNHRNSVQTGLLLLQQQARELLPLLENLAEQPLVI
jgi:hypothetical protein